MTLMPDLEWRSASARTRDFAESGALPIGLTGLNVRIKGITILDIKRGFFNPRSDADIYPLFLIAAPETTEPVVIQPVRVFNDISPGEALPLPDVAAPTIFRTAEELPPWIDVHVVVMKSRKRSRDLAKGILDALASDEGSAIHKAIVTAAAAANPTAAVVAPLAIGLLNLVCRFIAKEEDTQLFYSHASIEAADGYCIDQDIELTDRKHASVVLRVQARL
jgi:hypothetical protein